MHLHGAPASAEGREEYRWSLDEEAGALCDLADLVPCRENARTEDAAQKKQLMELLSSSAAAAAGCALCGRIAAGCWWRIAGCRECEEDVARRQVEGCDGSDVDAAAKQSESPTPPTATA